MTRAKPYESPEEAIVGIALECIWRLKNQKHGLEALEDLQAIELSLYKYLEKVAPSEV